MMHLNSIDYQAKYRRYLTSIVALQIIVALFIAMSMIMVGIILREGHDNQETILRNQQILRDCTDRRRADSECQKYQAERTDKAVNVLETVISAYVLCADRLDHDQKIKECVAERLSREG